MHIARYIAIVVDISISATIIDGGCCQTTLIACCLYASVVVEVCDIAVSIFNADFLCFYSGAIYKGLDLGCYLYFACGEKKGSVCNLTFGSVYLAIIWVCAKGR